MKYFSRHINEKGVVLITALLFIAIITIAGTSAYFTSSNELQISGNYKRMKQSFYDAEAGVAYTLAKIEKDISDNNPGPDPQNDGKFSNNSETISVTAPDGFSFTLVGNIDGNNNNVEEIVTNRYRFQATGNTGGTSTTLEIVFTRNNRLPYGLFGDNKLEIERFVEVYSYDSTVVVDPNLPTPADTTGRANIGSNGDGDGGTDDVLINESTIIDGDIDLGMAPDDTPANLDADPLSTINGAVNNVNRVDPDPLGAGVVGSDLANNFSFYSSPLNYDNGVAGIVGETLNMAMGDTVNLTDGNYYFTDVAINLGATLNIDASGGEVNIYLSGPLSAAIGSSIIITGPTTNVNIYSDSTDSIELKHMNSFKGMIYAPFSDIKMGNFSDIYGAIWGKNVEIKNLADFYYDTAIMDKWLDDTVSVTSWRDMRYE